MDEPKEKAMNLETLKALHGSIKKWQAIVDGTGIDRGPQNCPLCEMFLPYDGDPETDCEGCPVYEKVGQRNCQGTPYSEFYLVRNTYKTDEIMKHAKAELEFLKSLVPKDGDF